MRLPSVQLYFPWQNEQSSGKKAECITLSLQSLTTRLKFERGEVQDSVQLYFPYTVVGLK